MFKDRRRRTEDRFLTSDNENEQTAKDHIEGFYGRDSYYGYCGRGDD